MKSNGKLVMIIEDERNIREMYKEKFEKEGFEVKEYEDASLARNFLHSKEKDPDCIVLDIIMPGLDGFTFLKDVEKLKRKIPVLILTNLDNNFTVFGVKGSLPKGADAYLLKAQVDPAQVVDEVKNLISNNPKE